MSNNLNEYTMKRFSNFSFLLTTVIILILKTSTVIAQEKSQESGIAQKDQTFRFVYVAPDKAMDKQALRTSLEESYKVAIEHESPTIFYLANGKKPIVVEINTGANNQEDYENLFKHQIENNTSWIVDVSDRQRIIELLLRQNIIDKHGRLTYKHTVIDFHVGKDFWEGQKNEFIIGALYFDMGFSRYKNNDALFQYNVYLYCPAQFNYNQECPFGILNPDGINETVKIRKKQN